MKTRIRWTLVLLCSAQLHHALAKDSPSLRPAEIITPIRSSYPACHGKPLYQSFEYPMMDPTGSAPRLPGPSDRDCHGDPNRVPATGLGISAFRQVDDWLKSEEIATLSADKTKAYHSKNIEMLEPYNQCLLKTENWEKAPAGCENQIAFFKNQVLPNLRDLRIKLALAIPPPENSLSLRDPDPSKRDRQVNIGLKTTADLPLAERPKPLDLKTEAPEAYEQYDKFLKDTLKGRITLLKDRLSSCQAKDSICDKTQLQSEIDALSNAKDERALQLPFPGWQDYQRRSLQAFRSKNLSESLRILHDVKLLSLLVNLDSPTPRDMANAIVQIQENNRVRIQHTHPLMEKIRTHASDEREAIDELVSFDAMTNQALKENPQYCGIATGMFLDRKSRASKKTAVTAAAWLVGGTAATATAAAFLPAWLVGIASATAFTGLQLHSIHDAQEERKETLTTALTFPLSGSDEPASLNDVYIAGKQIDIQWYLLPLSLGAGRVVSKASKLIAPK